MLNLTAEQIAKTQRGLERAISGANSRILDIESQIERLSVTKFELQSEIDKNKKKQAAAAEALILVKGVPSKIVQMRNRILRMMERAKREDITVAESKSLTTNIEGLKAELQEVCSHPFIYDRPGYPGDHLNEWENRRPGHRYCIVCGFSEDTHESREIPGTYGNRDWLYKILTDNSDRVVKAEPRQEGLPINIWLPLGAVLHPFEEDVARVLNS